MLGETRIEWIDDPEHAVMVAAGHMQRLARRGGWSAPVRRWALRATHGCAWRDKRCEATALLAATRRDVRYVSDPDGLDLIQDPEWTLLEAGGGDCDCLSTLFAAGAVALSIPVVFIVGGPAASGPPSHVLPVIFLDGQWQPVEVSSSVMPIGRWPPGFRGRYFVRV